MKILPNEFSICSRIDINVPIEWHSKGALELELKPKLKKANRFIRRLARLCKRFGYRIDIEIERTAETKNAAE